MKKTGHRSSDDANAVPNQVQMVGKKTRSGNRYAGLDAPSRPVVEPPVQCIARPRVDGPVPDMAAGLPWMSSGNVQRRTSGAADASGGKDAAPGVIHQRASAGVSGNGGPLPHLDKIQQSFGSHDVTGVQAHVGGQAATSAASIDAEAYAMGNHVAFRGTPTLHTAAHEAAHVVQQRGGVQLKGGVGSSGDRYERHADEVADMVVQGKSAEGKLSEMSGGAPMSSAHTRLQRKARPGALQVAQRGGPARSAAGKLPAQRGNARQKDARPTHDNLEDNLKAFNNLWLLGMYSGIEDFADAAIERRINQIQKGDWGAFLIAVAGNLIWASAGLTTGGAAFALGVIGIELGSLGNFPKPAGKGQPMTTAKQAMKTLVEHEWSARHAKCDAIATKLLAAPHLKNAGRDKLLVEFLQDNFPNQFSIKAGGPQLEPTKIRNGAIRAAVDLFRRWMQEVEPIGKVRRIKHTDYGGSMRETTTGRLGFILVPDRPYTGRPALVEHVHTTTNAGLYTRTREKYRFKRWISADLAHAATMQEYGTGKNRLTLKPQEVSGMPASVSPSSR